jgi:two-component system, LuxR family, response regulator FixJ
MDVKLSEHAGAISAQGPVVIVVDDDPAVLGALKFALELEGFRIAAYRSGSELLAEPVFPTTGCLVIDYKLPEMDGLSLIADLRKRGFRLPAILITTNPTRSLRRRAAAVAAPIVEKPLFGDALSNAVWSILADGRAATA